MLNQNYEFASALGVTVWQPRTTRCLVVQYGANLPATTSLAEQKILTGMLSVLNLPAADIKQVVIRGDNAAAQLIALVARWNVQNVLLLDATFPAVLINNMMQTFSPNFLLNNPQHKPEAYKALLNLRAMIHGTS